MPPEATRLKPRDARFRANSTRPVLSDTLNRAETQGISHYSRALARRSPGYGEGTCDCRPRPSTGTQSAGPAPGLPRLGQRRAARAGGRAWGRRDPAMLREGLTELAWSHGCSAGSRSKKTDGPRADASRQDPAGSGSGGRGGVTPT